MANFKCLRCNEPMENMGISQFQLGKTGWILGDWSNLLSGAMELAVYSCPNCKKVEFFLPEVEELAEDRTFDRYKNVYEDDTKEPILPL